MVIDCVGSSASIAQSLAVVRPRGQVVLCGMPSMVTVDLTPLWHREVQLGAAYAYGLEPTGDRTFDLALDLVRRYDLGRLVTATYPLARYEDALAHAAGGGQAGGGQDRLRPA